MKFSEKLYTLRRSANMTQTELAEKLNVSRQAVSRWEMGTAKPEVDTIIAMSDLFGITLDELLKNKEEAPHLDIPEPPNSTQCFWDFIPKWWWVPGLFMISTPPSTATSGLSSLSLIPLLTALSVISFAVLLCCFGSALVRWLKDRKQ